MLNPKSVIVLKENPPTYLPAVGQGQDISLPVFGIYIEKW